MPSGTASRSGGSAFSDLAGPRRVSRKIFATPMRLDVSFFCSVFTKFTYKWMDGDDPFDPSLLNALADSDQIAFEPRLPVEKRRPASVTFTNEFAGDFLNNDRRFFECQHDELLALRQPKRLQDRLPPS